MRRFKLSLLRALAFCGSLLAAWIASSTLDSPPPPPRPHFTFPTHYFPADMLDDSAGPLHPQSRIVNCGQISGWLLYYISDELN
jgi:hypothetical protein